MIILSWYENYTEEEVPPENLWDDSEAMEEHFKAVRARREDGLKSGPSDEDSDNDSGMGQTDVLGNELSGVFKN